jgi:predicted nuclease of predicted toxin-antitoxin system
VSILYQADADLNQAIVTGVLRRKPEIDFQTAFAAGLSELKDQEVLQLAARQGRILVTHDLATPVPCGLPA